MSFSERLKEARISLGYKQKQVADAMGVEISTYCGYETGKRQPDVAKIKQLASILEVSGDFLLETGFSSSDQEEADAKTGPYSLQADLSKAEQQSQRHPADAASVELIREYRQLNQYYQNVVKHLVKDLLDAQKEKED